MNEQDLHHLDNKIFSVTMTANEWAAIGQMLEGFLSTGNRIDIVVSAHEKIVEAAQRFIKENTL